MTLEQGAVPAAADARAHAVEPRQRLVRLGPAGPDRGRRPRCSARGRRRAAEPERLAEETGETQNKLRPIMKKLVEDKRIKKMPSQPLAGGGGSTGTRWRMPTEQTGDGLAI
jgi:hypothetical protein